jgi:hypothetical protein
MAICYYSLKVNSGKRDHVTMDLKTLLPEGIFLSANKGQKFKQYPDEIKKEVIRLIVEENWSQRQVQALYGI